MSKELGVTSWTVYDHPLDYPNEFIARRWAISGERIVATGDVIRGATLAAIRDELMRRDPQLICLPRMTNDDPKIVEVWI